MPTAHISVEVFDYDLVGANDLMGAIVPIPVDRLTRCWGRRAWFPLVPHGTTDTDGGTAAAEATSSAATGGLGEVELCFRLHYNPATQRPDETDEDAGASRPLVRKVVEVKQSLMDNPLLDVCGDIPAPVSDERSRVWCTPRRLSSNTHR